MVGERKTKDELLVLLDKCPQIINWYRHKKSGAEVITWGRAIIEATGEPAVIYAHGNIMWVRPLAEFLAKFERVN